MMKAYMMLLGLSLVVLLVIGFVSYTKTPLVEGQTDKIGEAVKRLSDKAHLEVRMAGISSLERIARESKEDYRPVMGILDSYVVEHAPWPPSPEDKERAATAKGVRPGRDIEEILFVMERLYNQFGGESPNLWKTDLRGVYLASPAGRRSNLRGWFFSGSNLYKAKLMHADLSGAFFCPYQQAGGHVLPPTILDGADFEGAILKGTRLEGADLSNTNISGNQIDEACSDPRTKLPKGIAAVGKECPKGKYECVIYSDSK